MSTDRDQSKSGAPAAHRRARTERMRPLAAAVVVGLTLLFAYVSLFTAAFRDPQPEGLRVAVSAPDPVAERLERQLAREAPGVYDLERVGSPQAARAAVLDREVDGGLVAGVAAPRVLIAEAGGMPVAEALREGLTRALAAGGADPEVRDLRPLPDNDSGGLTSFFTTIGVLIAALATAIVLWLFAPTLGLAGQLGTLSAFAALGGLVVAITTGTVVDTLDGAFWSLTGVVALLALAIALPTAALLRWLGGPGAALSVLVMLLIGLSSTGGVLSPAFLPAFFELVGPLLPPGAGREALREVVYFGGNGSADSLAVLAAWALAGAGGLGAAAAIGRRTLPELPFGAHEREPA